MSANYGGISPWMSPYEPLSVGVVERDPIGKRRTRIASGDERRSEPSEPSEPREPDEYRAPRGQNFRLCAKAQTSRAKSLGHPYSRAEQGNGVTSRDSAPAGPLGTRCIR
jgi:hypothetical protein